MVAAPMIYMNVIFQASYNEIEGIKKAVSNYLEEEEEICSHHQVSAEIINNNKITVQVSENYKYCPVYKGCQNISLFSLYYQYINNNNNKDTNFSQVVDMCLSSDPGSIKLGGDLIFNYLPNSKDEELAKSVIIYNLLKTNKVSRHLHIYDLLSTKNYFQENLTFLYKNKPNELLAKVFNKFYPEQ